MRNLVKNHHGVFTYRKYISGTSLRISLQTKDKLEAFRIADKLNSILQPVPIANPDHIRAVICSVLSEIQPELQKERFNRLQNMLGISLEFDVTRMNTKIKVVELNDLKPPSFYRYPNINNKCRPPLV